MDKIPSTPPQTPQPEPSATAGKYTPLRAIRVWGRFVVNIAQILYNKGFGHKSSVRKGAPIDRRTIQHATPSENSGKIYTQMKASLCEKHGQLIRAAWLRSKASEGIYELPANEWRHFRILGKGVSGQADLGFKGLAGKFEVKKTSHFGNDNKAEIALTRRLDHPNIIKISPDTPDAGQGFHMQNGGASLLELAPDKARPSHASRPLFISIARQLAEALAYLKKEQVLHRDIKPANIAIDQDGHITLIDFGIAYDGKTDIACDPNSFGSPSFMAPDLMNCTNPQPKFSDTADMYAAGQTLFGLLTGEVLEFPDFEPRYDQTEEDAWDTYRQEPDTLAVLDKIAPQITQALQGESQEYIDTVTDLLKKMIHPDPEHRITPEELQKHPLFVTQHISLVQESCVGDKKF